jgi:Uma2 family endonuclease
MSKAAAESEPEFYMTREEYRAWAEQQPRGRFERINGIVVARDGATAISPERVGHNLRKFRTAQVLDAAVRAGGLRCTVYTDGVTVEVDDSDCEPDAVLSCGQRLPYDALAVPDPLVIVEVLSPSSRRIDRVLKREAYFRLPSLRHYLIVWPDQQRVLHHCRTGTGGIETRIITAGRISLDPPGIAIALEDIYAD